MRLDPHGNGQEHKRWPNGRTERLKVLWPDNPASVIADEFGVTRNAVISKANRMHLKCKKQPAKKKHVPPAPVRQIVRHFPAPPPPPMIQPPSLDLTIYQLGDSQCHYPHGEVPPFLFCGQPVRDMSPYCPFHHRLCNYPISTSRRDLALDVAHWRGVR